MMPAVAVIFLIVEQANREAVSLNVVVLVHVARIEAPVESLSTTIRRSRPVEAVRANVVVGKASSANREATGRQEA